MLKMAGSLDMTTFADFRAFLTTNIKVPDHQYKSS